MNEARRQFYKNFIEANKLFAAAKKLLNHGDKRVAFPPSVDKLEFSNQMGTYFVEKIHNIHTNLENMGHDLPEIEVYNTSETTAHLSNFNTLTEEDVRTLIKECGKKNSAVDPQEVTLLVTLDLSSAFDTVNHELLLRRLQNEFGIHGKVLDWFKSYLHNRGQQISTEGILSQRFYLDSGVPQWSCQPRKPGSLLPLPSLTRSSGDPGSGWSRDTLTHFLQWEGRLKSEAREMQRTSF